MEVVRMAGAQSGVAGVHWVKLSLVVKPILLTLDPLAGKQKPSRGRAVDRVTGLWLPEENGRALPIERERVAERRRWIGSTLGVETKRRHAVGSSKRQEREKEEEKKIKRR